MNSSVDTPLKLMLYGPVGLRLKWMFDVFRLLFEPKGEVDVFEWEPVTPTPQGRSLQVRQRLMMVLESRLASTLT